MRGGFVPARADRSVPADVRLVRAGELRPREIRPHHGRARQVGAGEVGGDHVGAAERRVGQFPCGFRPIDDETFGQDASLIVTLPQSAIAAFSARITDMTAGRVEIIQFTE